MAPCVAARLHSDSSVVVGVALDGVATDLNHSSVGLIVAALAAAARLDARNLGELVRSPGLRPHGEERPSHAHPHRDRPSTDPHSTRIAVDTFLYLLVTAGGGIELGVILALTQRCPLVRGHSRGCGSGTVTPSPRRCHRER